MDTELIRFRIDAEVREKAVQICADLGYELSDVLKALVSRIARDGTLPFDMAGGPVTPATTAPFYNYDERLWAGIKPQIDAEVALQLLARFIADCSTTLDEEDDKPTQDVKLKEKLTAARTEARALRSQLDVSDHAAVKAVLEKYGPLVRASTSS
jgi:addiction module RelB/DinJ family antitoxin